jgi:sec-independent protein translocase protein TatA
MGIGNPVHLMFIAAVALIVLGPKRLPDLVRSLGNGIREFRESLNEAASDDPAPPEPVGPVGPVEQLPSADAPDRRPL